MKITSGRLLLRYWIAASALSALSTSMSYFSRARARNRRAVFESSTINARFAPMLHSQRRARHRGKCSSEPPAFHWCRGAKTTVGSEEHLRAHVGTRGTPRSAHFTVKFGEAPGHLGR